MNNHIFNTRAKHLLMAGYGKSEPDDSFIPIATDGGGRMILSPDLTIQAEANALDIRPLDWTRDSASITVSNLDIRDLTGTRDNLEVFSQSFAQASESAIFSLSSRVFLPTDVSPYRKNTFYVRNSSALSVLVTVALQIAPINTESYYVADGSSFSLIGGSTVTFQPTRLMRYARILVTATLLANITVYYFGQT